MCIREDGLINKLKKKKKKKKASDTDKKISTSVPLLPRLFAFLVCFVY